MLGMAGSLVASAKLRGARQHRNTPSFERGVMAQEILDDFERPPLLPLMIPHVGLKFMPICGKSQKLPVSSVGIILPVSLKDMNFTGNLSDSLQIEGTAVSSTWLGPGSGVQVRIRPESQ